MKASQFLITTLKEAPADAEVVSHRLMVRAGMIKKLSAGVYTLMPLGLRVVRKVEAIVREEMNAAGAIEVVMPIVQPAELWSETGRFASMGPELLRIRDRHERDFVIQPTSEEVVTDIARQEFRSYKVLPKTIYQIQTKFRDERRPRFGLMRGREFVMKDAYSFDRNREGAQKSYAVMSQAYRQIFDRLGLKYRAVAADSGAIGGDLSEEFQVIAATGEDAVVYCPNSDYAANLEKAETLAPQTSRALAKQELKKVPTKPSKCEEVAALLAVPLAQLVKTLWMTLEADPAHENSQAQTVLLLLRGDHEMNETKVKKVIGGVSGGQRLLRPATDAEITNALGYAPVGFLGPIGVSDSVRIVVDREVTVMSDWVCGANEPHAHYIGVNWGRDLPEPRHVADIRVAQAGDLSPDGAGVLAIERGIEVGHVFYLGTKYSAAMKAEFLDEQGKSQLMEMGCYGIGVTRLPAAAIEQNHDERGMIWPDAIAPFTVVLCPIGADRSPEVQSTTQALYDSLVAFGVDVIWDDRDVRPGFMFADWDLIGVPHRVVISAKGLQEGLLEYQHRAAAPNSPTRLSPAAMLEHLKNSVAKTSCNPVLV